MWDKISPEVIMENNTYILPLNGSACDMFSSFTTNKIKLVLQVKKDKISTDGNTEFAVFLTDDLITFLGQEFGFRFRLDQSKNIYSPYGAAVVGILWVEYPLKIDCLEDPHVYNINIHRWWIFNLAVFRVDGKIKSIMLAHNKGKPYNLVLTSHNPNNFPVDDYHMKIKNVLQLRKD